MTNGLPDTEAVAVAGPRPPKPPPAKLGAVTLVIALLACLLSAVALAISLGRTAPPARAAAPPPPAASERDARPRPDAAGPLVAIELLLPHLAGSAPFPRPFAVALTLAAGDAEAVRALLPLAAAAADGAPVPAELRAGLSEAARTAAMMELGFAPDAGWFARRVADAVRVGTHLGAQGTPALAVLRQVDERLAAGDAAGAEAALAALPPDGAALLSSWREGLRRRIAADDAAARLAAIATARAGAAAR